MVFFLCFLIFLVGLYCVLIKKNLLKIVIGIGIMEYSANLFLVLLGYRKGGIPPIVTQVGEKANFVDPLPQALVITAIVINLATLCLIVSLCMRIYEKYKTFDVTEIRRLKG